MSLVESPPLSTIEASDELLADLRGAGVDARADYMTRLLYSTDASIYQMMPVGVTFPRDADQVSAIIEVAARHGVPVLPRGGGSSLAGQAVGNALIMDFSRHMYNVVSVDAEAKSVRVQPGITLGQLNRHLASYGLFFGPDPASGDRANLGGIVGNNSTGSHSIVYGMTADHVLRLDVVLSDGAQTHFDAFDGDWKSRAKRAGLEGEIYRTLPDIIDRYAEYIDTRYPKTFRTVSGYDLKRLRERSQPNVAHLLTGSEGTLAATTEITLNLVEPPKHTILALLQFDAVRPAMEAVPALLESDPTAVEVIDQMLLELVRGRVEYRHLLRYIEGDPAIVLIVEYAGDTEAECEDGIARLKRVLAGQSIRVEPLVLPAPADQAAIWYVRKLGLGILMSVQGDAKPIPFIEDAAVPVQYLAEYIDTIHRIAADVGVKRVAMYAHASAGCIHVRPLVNLKTADGVRQLRAIAEGSLELIQEFGGTISGEHADGLVRGEFIPRQFGPEMMSAFGEVKTLFDPQNRMNPGKIIDVPRMDDESLLRYGTDYETPLAPTFTVQDFGEFGFTGAVEMCNGAGVCRKIGQGVMCPSYMATREEKDSTRGRANALRAAMMGKLGTDGMTSHEVYDVLDLCLSCKACKSECPSSVDMSKLKHEFLQGYYDKHGTPLRSRLFANIARLNAFGQPFGPLANVMMGGPVKWGLTALGVHRNRTLPRFAMSKFSTWWRSHARQREDQPSAREVVLFNDTFMEYNQPEVGQAAVRVLEAAGYKVTVVEKQACCGRPAMSKGLMKQAQAMAAHNVSVLAEYAAKGIPIVGLEPSCISALRDDTPDLVGTDEARKVAKMSMLLDDFLVQEAAEGRFTLEFGETPRRVLFHGHCHQKAVFGAQGSIDLLRLMPDCEVSLIESGCCGMAGSFGYEEEHYDISIQLAEMTLAPAVREADADTVIAATGTSCRDQIDHTTEREARHPLQILADALAD